MLINDTCRITGLTKKALTYYEEQALISPCVLENGYRDFSPDDIALLKKIAVLRGLGLGTKEIKTVLNDSTGNAIKRLSVEKELGISRASAKKAMLDRLAVGESYEDIGAALKSLDASATITERLLEIFPGYFGRFICLHFAQFLNESILTDDQNSAYTEIVSFLDNMPSPEFSSELQDYLDECSALMSTANFGEAHSNVQNALENTEDYLAENKVFLEEYFLYKKSDEYKASPAYKMQGIMKSFLQTSGYYDVFIPAMKRLSGSYAEYYEKMLLANEVLLKTMPEIENLNE